MIHMLEAFGAEGVQHGRKTISGLKWVLSQSIWL